MPDATINHTSAGWPYLDENNYIDIIDNYSLELATKLENSDADVAAAINAANRAEIAAGVAVAAAGRFAAGQVNITLTNQPGATIDVTFPAGRFTAPPFVFVVRASSGLAKFIPYTSARSADKCTLGLYAGDGTAGNATVPLLWFAIQP